MVDFLRQIFRNMNILHVKNLLMPCVSVVVSGDFCRFKLALPSLLSMSFDISDLFIFRNIYRCKSTIFRSPYYSL